MTINPDVVPGHKSVIGQMNLADSPVGLWEARRSSQGLPISAGMG